MNDYQYIMRAMQGMNLKKLSREAGVHYITLYNVATGKVTNPTIKTVNKIADCLKIRSNA